MNQGVLILVLLVLMALGLALVLYLGLKQVSAILEKRLRETERVRRRQYGELLDRVERENDRLNRDLLAVRQLMEASAQGSEERIEQLLTRLTLSLDQQQRQMKELREQVDTKLQKTLENSLGDSFRQVSEQLEKVYRGLGEMQRLAGSVGDLKKVLSGVKTRGVWGEVRLGALIEENLTPEQYLTDTPVEPGNAERVEFAIKLPGKGAGEAVLLPIDAKYPQEDYERLVEASEGNDKQKIEKCAQALERSILTEARRISTKYIRVPHTTDFAVMFLATEGLYAEALKRPGLAEKAQREWRVLIAGPSTLSALLTSLQMGFRTLAVEQRSEEIWRLLGSVRGEFVKFATVLDRTRAHLTQAGADLDAASSRTREISRELGRVDQLSVPDTWRDEDE